MKDFAQKILADVSANKAFVLHHGGTTKHIRNLIDLRLSLESMNTSEFNHHVNEQKNDFAAWVDNSVKDDKLAHDIAGNVSKYTMVTKVGNRIDFAVDIIEKENQKLLDDELSRLHTLPQKSAKQKSQIETLEKDLRRVAKNIKLEKKVHKEPNDLKIKKGKDSMPIPANARIVEFIFGLVIGLLLGLALAKMILPL
jgi:F0F1-type ATP synthase assembly protein I